MKIPFAKYTTYGNNFIIVDETEEHFIPESQLSNCATQVTNTFFNVGADSLIVIQKYNKENIERINRDKKYWHKITDGLNADYIFRMFEPNGDEALNCGNGLLALSKLLFHKKQQNQVNILTEIPSSTPRIRVIGTNEKKAFHWVNIGSHKRVRERLAISDIRQPVTEFIDKVENIKIDFEYDEFKFLTLSSVDISGYMLSTGEPHFIIFTDTIFQDKEKGDMLFKVIDSKSNIDVGLWFVNYIGSYINRQYSHYFPEGINVNFVKILDEKKGIIQHRCFERGINRETMACGTGATAVAALSLSLDMISSNKIQLLPHRCRRYNSDAEIHVERKDNDYFLHGHPHILCNGEFFFNPDK
jgi:diaminopimelate epimerase